MGMKDGSLRIRLNLEKYRDTLEYLKLTKGGITGFVEKCLDQVEVDKAIVEAVKKLKEK